MESLPSRRYSSRSPADLPNLNDLLSDREPSVPSRDSILALLRRIVLKSQGDSLQPFYSIRAVADQFHLPRATIGRIYRRLCDEGLLRAMWGSKTFLEPTDSAKGKKLATIGIAVDLCRFRDSSEYCDHILSLQDAIRRHRIIERLIFFRDVDEVPQLLRRHDSRSVRAILWSFPEVNHGNTLLRLHDMGMRIICLGGAPIRGIRYCYAISRRGSLGRIVRERLLKII
jgi:hypothetical protein